MKIITTSKAPTPAGHYVQGRLVDGWLYVSGQLPLHADTGKLNNATIDDEARQTLENLRQVIEAAGLGLGDVVKVNIYLSDIAHWPGINRLYADFFGTHRPARSVIACSLLHFGARIEVDAVAYAGSGSRLDPSPSPANPAFR
jgi:2-iminobutanoate/2-iminopropanoate deaminase